MLLALLWPSAARALPPVASDVVVASDGSTTRGRITELVTGDHVTVTKRSGEQVRIPWSMVTRIDREGRSLPLPGPTVRVHIDGPADVAMEVFDPVAQEHTVVCYAPCDRDLPSGLLYRLSAQSVRDSGHFLLRPNAGGETNLVLEGGSKSAFAGGVGLVVAGSAVTLTGFVVILGSAFSRAGPYTTAADVERANERQTAGEIIAGVGLLALAPGVVLMTINATTAVRQVPRPAREPTWTKPVVPEGPAASVFVPLAALRF